MLIDKTQHGAVFSTEGLCRGWEWTRRGLAVLSQEGEAEPLLQSQCMKRGGRAGVAERRGPHSSKGTAMSWGEQVSLSGWL